MDYHKIHKIKRESSLHIPSLTKYVIWYVEHSQISKFNIVLFLDYKRIKHSSINILYTK